MILSYESNVAKEVGVNAASVLHTIRLWVIANAARNVHIIEGKAWTYFSYPALAKINSSLTEKQVRAAVDKLISFGYVEVGHFSKGNYNRTTWYTTTEKADEAYSCTEKVSDYIGDGVLPKRADHFCPNGQNGSDQMGRTITSTNITKQVHKNKSRTYDHGCDAYKLAVWLAKKIKENLPNKNFEESTLQSWAKDIDLLIRKDGADPDDVAEVITWVQQDGFWKSNILSGKKLRQQYDRIRMMIEDGKSPRK